LAVDHQESWLSTGFYPRIPHVPTFYDG
jgi:hypothetical protein